MVPPILPRIKIVISENYLNSARNRGNEEVNALIANARKVESGFYLDTDKEDDLKVNLWDMKMLSEYFKR
jgi:hypothetical protein